jgi:hypothetical protein
MLHHAQVLEEQLLASRVGLFILQVIPSSALQFQECMWVFRSPFCGCLPFIPHSCPAEFINAITLHRERELHMGVIVVSNPRTANRAQSRTLAWHPGYISSGVWWHPVGADTKLSLE